MVRNELRFRIAIALGAWTRRKRGGAKKWRGLEGGVGGGDGCGDGCGDGRLDGYGGIRGHSWCGFGTGRFPWKPKRGSKGFKSPRKHPKRVIRQFSDQKTCYHAEFFFSFLFFLSFLGGGRLRMNERDRITHISSPVAELI